RKAVDGAGRRGVRRVDARTVVPDELPRAEAQVVRRSPGLDDDGVAIVAPGGDGESDGCGRTDHEELRIAHDVPPLRVADAQTDMEGDLALMHDRVGDQDVDAGVVDAVVADGEAPDGNPGFGCPGGRAGAGADPRV